MRRLVVALALILYGGLAGVEAAPPKAATHSAWESEFAVYSSTSAPRPLRLWAYRRLRWFDPKVVLPSPAASSGLVFNSTSTVSALITKAQGGAVARHDKAMIVFPPGAVPGDFAVTLSTPAGYHPLEESLKSSKMGSSALAAASAAVEIDPESGRLSAPTTIYVPYDPARVQAQGLHEMDLQVFRWNRDRQVWEGFVTNVDLDRHVASAAITRLGLYQVLGRRPRQGKTP
jgi:hypothetical protein